MIAAGLLALAMLTAAPESATDLTVGLTVERDLGPGGMDAFRVPANGDSGPALLVRVEQLGVDLELVRLAPEGTELSRVDIPTGRRGEELLLLEGVRSAGEWIEVRALERRAPVGRYRMTIEPLATGTPDGDLRRRALAASVRGAERYAQGTPESRSEAAEAYGEALRLWQDSGDRRQVARTLSLIAILERIGGAADDARITYQDALDRWRELGDVEEEAWVLNDLGYCRALAGDAAGALAAYDQAIPLWETLGDSGGLGRTLNNKGLVFHQRGEPRLARPFYERAVELLEKAHYPALAATVLNNLAAVLDSIGEPEAAMATFERAIARHHELADPLGEARALGNQAVLFRNLGRLQEALEGYRRALDLQRTAARPAEIARTLSNLGELYLTLGEPSRARELAEESLPLRRQAGSPAGEAYSLHNLGAAERALGDLAAARTHFEAARRLFRTAGDALGEGNTLRTLGETLFAQGDTAGARECFEAALARHQGIDPRRGRGETLRRLAELELATAETERAREHFATARQIARETHHASAELEALLGLARAERQLGRAADAQEHAGAARQLLERLRATVATPELRASFAALRSGVTELEIDLAWDGHHRDPAAGHDRRAFETAHTARARTLTEGIEESTARAAIAPELAARRRALAERLSLKTLRLGDLAALGKGSPDESALLERESLATLADLEAVDADIARSFPRLADWSRPAVRTVPEVQALLDAETLLLSYTLGAERSWLFAVTPDSFASFELPPRASIETAARELHERWRSFSAGTPRGADRNRARAVAAMLLGPVRRQLATVQRVVVIPDGALGLLPFAALPDPDSGRPLVDRQEVTALPSIASLAALRARNAARPPAGRRLLIVADPVFDARDPRAPAGSAEISPAPGRLAWSGVEAEAVARPWPPAEVEQRLGLDAGLEAITGTPLEAFRILHLATHGIVDAERSERTGLLFSALDATGRRRPNFLGLPEIHGLTLAADLVVLSGCRTALGRELSNEGPMGLARGFLFAGATRVVASLWPVEDRATAELMTRFYRALAGTAGSPATALAQAQRALRAEPRWSHPYYWSGFVLYGDWR